MKKIIFIELLHHHECIENPYLIYKNKWYETRAILWEFVSQKLKNITEYNDEFYVLWQPNRTQFLSLTFFWKIKYFFKEFVEIYKNTNELKSIIKQEKPQILYINTIESPFLIPLMLYLLWTKNIDIYLAIHNTNRLKVWFMKYILYDFLIKKIIQKSKKIILLWEYLRFEDENTQNKVMYINNRIPQKNINHKKFKKRTFVMSGSLNYKQKDIQTVLRWFSEFLKKHESYQKHIQLVLLGQMNTTVENWIKNYNLTEIIVTFDHYVWEEDMEKYMSQAHYAIISTYEKSVYGKYKISWAFWDAVAFNIPILLSWHYAPEYMSKNIIRFDSHNIDKIIYDLVLKNEKY